MAARLSGLSPNLASRFTPGTLISSYETYEAVRQGDRGAVPEERRGVCTEVHRTPGCGPGRDDVPAGCRVSTRTWTRSTLRPCTPRSSCRRTSRPRLSLATEPAGFLPAVLEPLVELRRATKRLKKSGPQYEGIDSILKWMLVTCFGYTGYKNAKFGRIEVHEAITGKSRNILMQTKDIAEAMGFTVLHGIVDCLWVQGPGIEALRERVDRETGLFTEARAL